MGAMQTKSVLLIESDPDEATAISTMFKEQGLYSDSSEEIVGE